MANTHVCNQCNSAIVNNPNEKCKECIAELHKIVKDYIKRNLEVKVDVDRSWGYLEVKTVIKLDGEEIDSSTGSIYVGESSY